jgi:hypothetical protein
MGGRPPGEREVEAYEDALGRLRAGSASPVVAPGRWFVVDRPEAGAAARGDTLMLTRGALESGWLPALMAHELGHMRGMEARLRAAVELLELAPGRLVRARDESAGRAGGAAGALAMRRMRGRGAGPLWNGASWAARAWLALLRGGWGVRAMAPAWGALWREAEYGADAYAASVGEGEALVELLEREAASEEHPRGWAWLRGKASVPVALRVERLREVD